MNDQLRLEGRQYFNLSELPDYFDLSGYPLRLLFLADTTHVAGAVQQHIGSFSEYSCHAIDIVNSRENKYPPEDRAYSYDAILIHYSIFVLAESYLSHEWQEFISTFHGPVAVIHEDEYQNINAFADKFSQLGVDALFSCLDSKETLEKVYGKTALSSRALFFSCLPGYITPELLRISAPQTAERELDVVYRGRTLRPELGKFAQEKRLIGEQVLAVSEQYGLRCDISSAEEDRIYGADWPKFLMSGKAMLGVEGGATIFDFDGTISSAVSSYIESHPMADFNEIWSNVLIRYEGNVNYKTITPKFFEAIATKTVLILYPGAYSNILVPGRHFIQLERDGSNIEEVVGHLRDDAYLQSMANRTYDDIFSNPKLYNKFYVSQIDKVLSFLVGRVPSTNFVHAEIIRRLNLLRTLHRNDFKSVHEELIGINRNIEELIRVSCAIEEKNRNLQEGNVFNKLLKKLVQTTSKIK